MFYQNLLTKPTEVRNACKNKLTKNISSGKVA